jgi:hypothetical protein
MEKERFVLGKTKFPWGKVVKVHEVGEYQIIEYHGQIMKNGTGTGKYEPEKTTFHVYGESHSYDSLDKALIGAICLKHDGCNTRADYYIFNMLRMGK